MPFFIHLAISLGAGAGRNVSSSFKFTIPLLACCAVLAACSDNGQGIAGGTGGGGSAPVAGTSTSGPTGSTTTSSPTTSTTSGSGAGGDMSGSGGTGGDTGGSGGGGSDNGDAGPVDSGPIGNQDAGYPGMKSIFDGKTLAGWLPSSGTMLGNAT